MAMNSRQRMDIAMRLGEPDRVPVMCQLALGHYFLETGLDPVDIWHSTEAFGDALITLQRRYGFDGILVNLPGRDPNWRSYVARIEQADVGNVVRWTNGWTTEVPADDLPHAYREDGTQFVASLDQVDPAKLFYVEPHDLGGVKYPFAWGLDPEPRRDFPPCQFDTIQYVIERTGGEVSVHSEVFSPFSQLMELLGYVPALMALIEQPDKLKACLDALATGALKLARGQAGAGANAILISSAFAGAGFISRQHYSEFVLPYERKIVEGVQVNYDIPVYTHTCGAIADRLDLMAATGTNGIDTLDPPPLGTVELAEARRQTFGRLFLKGNLDPVNTLLMGTREQVFEAARECILTAAAGGGYILSTACSVAPATSPANLLKLREAAEEFGSYPITRSTPARMKS